MVNKDEYIVITLQQQHCIPFSAFTLLFGHSNDIQSAAVPRRYLT